MHQSSDSPAAAWPDPHPDHWMGTAQRQVMGQWTNSGQIHIVVVLKPFTCCPTHCCAPAGGVLPKHPPACPIWLSLEALGTPWGREEIGHKLDIYTHVYSIFFGRKGKNYLGSRIHSCLKCHSSSLSSGLRGCSGSVVTIASNCFFRWFGISRWPRSPPSDSSPTAPASRPTSRPTSRLLGNTTG